MADEEIALVSTSSTSPTTSTSSPQSITATDDRDAGADRRIDGGYPGVDDLVDHTDDDAGVDHHHRAPDNLDHRAPDDLDHRAPDDLDTVPPTTLPPTTVPPTIAITDRAGVAVLVINGGAAVGTARAATEQLRRAGFQPRAAVDAVQGVERRALVLHAPGQEAAANSVNETIGAAPDAVVPALPGDPTGRASAATSTSSWCSDRKPARS